MRLLLPITIVASSSIASADNHSNWHSNPLSKFATSLISALVVLPASVPCGSLADAKSRSSTNGQNVCTADDTSPECLNPDIDDDEEEDSEDESSSGDNEEDDEDDEDEEDEEDEEDASNVEKLVEEEDDEDNEEESSDDEDDSSDDDEDETVYSKDETCHDKHESCDEWAKSGRCDDHANHAGYMLKNCPKSCKICLSYRTNDFGEPQLIPAVDPDDVETLLEATKIYMDKIRKNPKYKEVWTDCRNNEAQCSKWALGDGCSQDPDFMKRKCGPACQSCDYVRAWKQMCKPDPNEVGVIEPGGLNKLFETMVAFANERGFEPRILSSPSGEDGITGPWVATLDNFLSDKEISALLHWGEELGYERATTKKSTSSHRTSSTAHCRDECYDDPTVVALRQKLVDITTIPEGNHENLQLLKSDVDQLSKLHHDFKSSDLEFGHGPTILSFSMFLNDVEEGGGIRFPKLENLTVEPKKGRVLVWASVSNDDFNVEESRTYYEELPVIKGQKFATDAKFRIRDFQKGVSKGCSATI